MPNWCMTNIYINNENEEELKDFYKKLEEWTSKNYCENGFGLRWLGNVLGNSGIDTMENGDFNIRCRGWIEYFDLCDSNQLQIQTATAWVPMVKMWVKVCEKYLPNAEIIYTAEECGMILYITNDHDLAGKYVVDVWKDEIANEHEICTDWEADEQYVIEVLQKILKSEANDVNKLMEMFDENDIEGIIIHEWEYCSANDCD